MIYEHFLQYNHVQGNQAYANCPFHVDKTPSLTVNLETSEWYCHSCQRGGAEKEFISKYFDVSSAIAKYVLDYINGKKVLPFPSQESIEAFHQKLLSNAREMKYLNDMGISTDVINEYKLGIDDLRITIPVTSRRGFVINIRKYLPPHRRHDGTSNAKCLNMRGLGEKRYFPYDAFYESDDIYIVEGEKDCLVARSQGFNAVTSTGGSTIPINEIQMFRNKNVYLMLDTDTAGKRSAKSYVDLLQGVAQSIWMVTLPSKDFAEFFAEYKNTDISGYLTPITDHSMMETQIQALDTTLTRSEFSENLNTWIRLTNMSVIGADPKIYTVPSKLKVTCNSSQCKRDCPLALGMTTSEMQTITLEPRQLLQFLNSPDSAQDSFLRKMFGCKSVIAEPLDMVNVQNVLFQESASFLEGLDDATSDSRYGLYVYTDYRLNPTMKYNFEACRVTDPKTQKNFYVIRTAENVGASRPIFDDAVFQYYRDIADKSDSFLEMMDVHYQEWMAALSIEGRLDLFSALMLTYASVTEIPYNHGLIKGWLDIMVIGDTRTGKSQMAQRLLKELQIGGYINGENSRATGVIGGVQKIGDAWMITWGAVPMNDKGLLFVDEASGLEIEDIKNLSSTRSSGAVTMNKIIKGEARARTRVVWMSNPRSGKNIGDFYWKGFGAFREYIPIEEDQARYDLVLTAAREDIELLEGIEVTSRPNVESWRALFSCAWNIASEDVLLDADIRTGIREISAKLTTGYGGSSLIVGVAVHEKLLRLSCAVAVLCGSIFEGKLMVTRKHLDWAHEFLVHVLNKPSLAYRAYISELRRAERQKQENIDFLKGLFNLHPALRALLSADAFRGNQLQEVLGIDRSDCSRIMGDLLAKGLMKPGRNGTYLPDKLLLETARMEVLGYDEY